MNHFPHQHHHRRATRYALIPPPPPPLNHHLRHHHHDLFIPILLPPPIPVVLDHGFRHHLPMVSPYHHPHANRNYRRVVLDDQRVAINRRSENRISSSASRDSSLDSGDEQMVVRELTSTIEEPEKRKSAFLRIQPPKPNTEECEIEQLNYAEFDVDSNPNSNSSSSEDNKHGCLGNGKKKLKKKRGSAVEVDVSFESNSLVVKAVVSNTDVTAVSDTHLIPSVKKGKKRKALVSDIVSSDSQLGKPSTGAVNSDDTSNSAKVLVAQNNAPDSCSKAMDNPQGKIQVAPSSKSLVPDEIASVQSDKTISMVVKKKKVVKKEVKKVVKPNSYKLSPLSAHILVGTWMAGGVTHSSSVKIKKTSFEEKNTEDKKGTHSSSQECNTDKGSAMGIKRVGNISKPSYSDSNKEDKRIDPNIPNTDKVAKSLNEDSPSPEKDSKVGCPQSSTDGLINSHLLNAHHSISASGRVPGLSSNNLTARSEVNFAVCDIGNDDDVVGRKCCELDPPTLSQDAILVENPDIVTPLTSSGMASCLGSAKTMVQDGLDCLQQASVVKQGSDSETIDSEDRTTFPHADIVNDSEKNVSPRMCPTINRIATLNVRKGVSEAELCFGSSSDIDADKASRLYKRKKTNDGYPNFTRCPSELSDDLISLSNKQAHKEEVARLNMAVLSASPLVPYTEDIAKLPDNSLGGESSVSVDLNREMATSENLDLHHHSIASHPLVKEPSTPNVHLSMLEGEQKEKATQIVPINTETDIVQRSPSVNMETFGINMKNDLLPLHNYCMFLPVDGDVVTSCKSFDALVETVPDALSALPSPQGITPEASDRRVSDCLEMNTKKICGDRSKLDSNSLIEPSSDLRAFTSPPQRPGKIIKLDHVTGQSNLTMRKMMLQPSLSPSKVGIQQSNYSELNGTKNVAGSVTPKTLKGHSFIFSKPRTPASSTNISKLRTWHRTGNNSPASFPGTKPSVRTVPPEKPNIQSTNYIRKGNSLVRKPTPVSTSSQISVANQLPSLGLDESRKNICSESRVCATDQPHLLTSGVKNAPLKEGKRTVTLPIDSNLESGSFPLIVNLSVGCCENEADPKNVIENDAPSSSEDVLKSSITLENQIGISNNGRGQVEVNDGNISSSNKRRTVYVKPKSNQLVATSNFCGLSVSTDETQTACSAGYYKNGNNQLLRTSFVSHTSPTVVVPNRNVNSGGLGACKVICRRRFNKRRSQKVAGSLCKPLKTSLVWTLSGKSSPKNDIDTGNCQKFLSQMFPWKRSIFRRRFIQNPASSSNRSSSSAISKKLLLLRKRDAVYLRSTHGFSIRKSNVLGVGGSSSKWSKSICRRSAKVAEEATAVAAVEREKIEQKDVACNSSQAKNNEPLPSASIQSGLVAQGYIPRYVRIGNGNQPIRDPKRRIRMLANEKVRWSLHTARQRLARKQKYCQFFTRFGKCNKGDGKCAYIHDPSKIVCTKFLNGLCSNANCKLTHKVIPERMPDCSYFLQGLCTNRNCPYRHVSVNPKASVCGEFLKGYCGDGNECRKKHSYICPTFEETGSCQTGTKCKLHHPKKQGEGKKRKRSADRNNSGGRYFGSIPTDLSVPGMMVAQRQCQQSNNDKEGEVADFISFEVDEEIAEEVEQSHEQPTMFDTDPWDSQLDNLDELIRPVLIM